MILGIPSLFSLSTPSSYSYSWGQAFLRKTSILLLLTLVLSSSFPWTTQARTTPLSTIKSSMRSYHSTASAESDADAQELDSICRAYPSISSHVSHDSVKMPASVFPFLSEKIKSNPDSLHYWAKCASWYTYRSLSNASPQQGPADRPLSPKSMRSGEHQERYTINQTSKKYLHKGKSYTATGIWRDGKVEHQAFFKMITRDGGKYTSEAVTKSFLDEVTTHVLSYAVNTLHIVRVLDVITDNPTHYGLILEQGAYNLREYVNQNMAKGLPIKAHRAHGASYMISGLAEKTMNTLFDGMVGAITDINERAHVIHRDLKPDNIMVFNTKGGPILKITDFGIAILERNVDSVCSPPGQYMVGTVGFMPWGYFQPLSDETPTYVRYNDLYSLFATKYTVMFPGKDLKIPNLQASSVPGRLRAWVWRKFQLKFTSHIITETQAKENRLSNDFVHLMNMVLGARHEWGKSVTHQKVQEAWDDWKLKKAPTHSKSS
ncbi:kinase-like domain-containing protein [Piptocephalis cylindrospora]|uniref:Kinase-like domain-containing protein n=1 Tax=Piptocephalis cylindrospora TaxID=1907219 RepID=A0A4P9Y4E2_9FUNG|nr:kinase-like domain-containing protein [Piptocephalis cylindrospora]|eukprot:RKP13807.1 kinase-like domain-containing protein [Piptocephalis cylindrospora]